MNNFFLLDTMLKNEKMIYFSLILILIIGYLLFNKMKLKGLFILAIFIAVKLSIHNYVDDYIDSNKELKKISQTHIFACTMLVSLLITLPAILIAKTLGIEQ